MAIDVWVDFNSMQDGVVRTLATFASPGVVLTPGRDVVVGDEEGLIAKATVESVDGFVVTLRVDASSFHPHDDVPPLRAVQ